jgi:hypothetical protein
VVALVAALVAEDFLVEAQEEVGNSKANKTL